MNGMFGTVFVLRQVDFNKIKISKADENTSDQKVP
jgi:hypothetical protein